MEKTSVLFDEIRKYCKANANSENRDKYQRFFKEELIAYGLTSTQVRNKTKEILKNRKWDKNEFFDIMPLLFSGKMSEEISIGLLLLDGISKKFTLGDFERYSGFFQMGISNWAHADMLGMFTLPKFLKMKLVTPNDFSLWVMSEYKFQRRCVPVTFIKHLKSGNAFQTVIDILEPLMSDTAREVHQGMGWFLREAWKLEKEVVEDFLLLHVPSAPRLIFQYACEKMDVEEKKRFKKK